MIMTVAKHIAYVSSYAILNIHHNLTSKKCIYLWMYILYFAIWIYYLIMLIFFKISFMYSDFIYKYHYYAKASLNIMCNFINFYLKTYSEAWLFALKYNIDANFISLKIKFFNIKYKILLLDADLLKYHIWTTVISF